MADAPEDRSRAPAIFGAVMVLAAAGLIGAYLALGQAGARRVLGLAPVPEAPAATAPGSPRPKPIAGELRVTSEPPRAQVFLLIGRGPAAATDLPVGVAQEFVAIADGYAPVRAVVPANAQWEESVGHKLYELAMQATQKLPEGRAVELGNTLLPQDVGSPSGVLGTVRIVTTPKGAKVYQLIGFTPDVRVENLPVSAGYEVLVYLPGLPGQARRVEAGDFKPVDGKRIAELAFELKSPAR